MGMYVLFPVRRWPVKIAVWANFSSFNPAPLSDKEVAKTHIIRDAFYVLALVVMLSQDVYYSLQLEHCLCLDIGTMRCEAGECASRPVTVVRLHSASPTPARPPWQHRYARAVILSSGVSLGTQKSMRHN